MMKAYITKYALSSGIKEREATIISPSGDATAGFYYYRRGQWHETMDAAKEKAELMRLKKIASLEKSLTKLKELRF